MRTGESFPFSTLCKCRNNGAGSSKARESRELGCVAVFPGRESKRGKNHFFSVEEERDFSLSLLPFAPSLCYSLFSSRSPHARREKKSRKKPCRGTSGCWIGCEGKARTRGRGSERKRECPRRSIVVVLNAQRSSSLFFFSLSFSPFENTPASSSTRRWSSRSWASRTQGRRLSWACSRRGRSRRCDAMFFPLSRASFGGRSGKKPQNLFSTLFSAPPPKN